ncbi:uncharacterized protein LOC131249721 [Magnolia sinica]|uniref:uncharacterized protein LOC131249721 n=1 Tax=Magnolia sinica TaxID=86752 RepID=UPI002658F9BC|nr:uncharacterized protein LOC131249721 [Magnolia sinica]
MLLRGYPNLYLGHHPPHILVAFSVLSCSGASFKPRVQFRVVRRIPPPAGWYKLNTDESALGNPHPSGGGGICRNESRELIFAFSRGYGVGPNNAAELRAISDGLSLCTSSGLKAVEVETDSRLVVGMINGVSLSSSKWKLWLNQIANSSHSSSSIFRAIFREGNAPVDTVARLGSSSQVNVNYSATKDLPRVTLGLTFLDKVGLGSLRECR